MGRRGALRTRRELSRRADRPAATAGHRPPGGRSTSSERSASTSGSPRSSRSPSRSGYGETVLAFVVAGVVTSGGRLRARAADRPSAPDSVGVREGFLVVALDLAARGRVRGHPVPLRGRRSALEPASTPTSRACPASRRPERASSRTSRRSNRSLGIWRQFTQWLGGMGIIVLAIAVLPRLRVGGRQLMESELPGPEIAALGGADPLDRRGSSGCCTSGSPLLETLSLAIALGWLGIDDVMTPYEALAHAFSTMPTGGFSTQPGLGRRSFSAAAQWILVLFMAVAGANFVLMFRALVRRRPRALARDEEFRLYVALVLVGVRGAHGDAVGLRHRRGRGGGPRRRVPGRLDRSRPRGSRARTSPCGRRSSCSRCSR